MPDASPKLKRVLIVPDTHAPYHDKRAFALVLKVGQTFRPDILVTIGDLADFYAVSDHSKDPQRGLRFKQELVVVNRLLDQLDALGASDKVFVEGNHCDRLQRYLRDRAKELSDITSVPALLHLKERSWQYVPYKQFTKRGKLYFTHDVGQAGRYSVFRCLETFDSTVVTGHSHRFACVMEGIMSGERKMSAQFGWLGDVKQIDYMSRAKAMKDWALGFGIGHLHPNGTAYLTPVPILNYSCVVNGSFYSA